MKQKMLISAIAMIATMLWVGIPGNALKMPETRYGIVSLELAWNTDRAVQVVDTWQQHHLVTVAINNVYADFAFIIAYSLFLFLSVRRVTQQHRGMVKTLGVWLGRSALLAGACDLGENLLMLPMLYGHIRNSFAAGVGIFATVKFELIILVLLFILAAFILDRLKKHH